MYCGFAKNHSIMSSGTDFQEAFIMAQFVSFRPLCFMICVYYVHCPSPPHHIQKWGLGTVHALLLSFS